VDKKGFKNGKGARKGVLRGFWGFLGV